MKATDLLKKQHREVEALFKKIEAGSGREKKALFNELAEKLENHTKIEEKYFYPAGAEADEDLTLESYEEHDIVKALLRKIKKTSTGDETFMAKITVLKEIIEHHVEEEEEEYFPECEKTLGAEKLEELGEKMEATYLRLSGQPQKPSSREAMAAA